MEQKKRAQTDPEKSQSKCTNYLSPKQIIEGLFQNGGQYTAKQLNVLTNSNDARKCISDLRKSGFYIVDRRLHTMEKLYWLADDGQLNLWEEKA